MEVLVLLFNVLNWLLHAVYATYRRFKGALAVKPEQFEAINFDSVRNRISKLPRHVAFIVEPRLIDDNEASKLISSLAQLSYFCVKIGIDDVTIYDQAGKLIKLRYLFENAMSAIGCKEDNANGIHLKNGFQKKPYFNARSGVDNSMVRFLSAADGRPQILDATRQLIKDKLHNNDASIEPEELNGKLRENYQFNDPELVILLGRTFCLFDFLPWQIRLSEIFDIDLRSCWLTQSSEKLMAKPEINRFCEILSNFTKVQQRFGT